MDTSSDARRTGGTAAAKGSRFRSVTMIVVFDVATPLVAYKVLRSAGVAAVTALLLGGVFPALGVTIGAIRHRRLHVAGALVLAGIVAGTVLGMVSHSAQLVLVEGSVPTAVLGAACLGSLWARHPLIFILVLELTGPDTAKGQEMTRLWQHEKGVRRDFRVITAVWGTAFFLEAALRVVIVFNVSAGTALAISKVTPFLVGGIMSAWTIAYGAHRKKLSVRMAFATGQATDESHARLSGSRAENAGEMNMVRRSGVGRRRRRRAGSGSESVQPPDPRGDCGVELYDEDEPDAQVGAEN